VIALLYISYTRIIKIIITSYIHRKMRYQVLMKLLFSSIEQVFY